MLNDKGITEKRLQEIKRGAEDQVSWYYKDCEEVVYHIRAVELLDIIALAEGKRDGESQAAAPAESPGVL